MHTYTKITDLKDMLKKSGDEFGKNIAYKIRKEKNQTGKTKIKKNFKI